MALEAGAHGYVPKGLGINELSRALQDIRQGKIYVPPSVADLTEPESKSAQREAGVTPHLADPGVLDLTPRQLEVLALLVRGLSNKEIAQRLNLGEGTVKVHLAAMFRTLGVSSRAAAAALGAQLLSGQHLRPQKNGGRLIRPHWSAPS